MKLFFRELERRSIPYVILHSYEELPQRIVSDIDYAVLQKIYGMPAAHDTKYSPAQCIGTELRIVSGNPDPQHICTSYIERQNWTVRSSVRRYTRLSRLIERTMRNGKWSAP